MLRFIYCTLEMKIEIILGSCNFPSISIMKLPSWFGLCVPTGILIIISENKHFELKSEYKRDADCVIRSPH